MKDSLENNIKHNAEKNNFETNFSRMERGGLNYIKNERNYLILSALVPIYIIIVQCINLGYIFTAPPLNPLDPRPPPNIINVFTPISILLIISFFALVNFRYLLVWKNKVNLYEGKKTGKQKSLTSLFYDIIRSMEKIKIIFIIVNIISIYYFMWFVLWVLRIVAPLHPPPPLHVNILNDLSLLGLLIYLILQWKHFIQWNRKLTQLKLFEQKIYSEICES
ncbi:MAG: hypothetical protein ACFFCV_04130 [Promethearchaeota archaeon]